MYNGRVGVRETLLALMADQPKHGYQLKTEYETVAAPQRPLNIGQVYTTIERLVRDGLVEKASPSAASDSDERRRPYRLTREGRSTAHDWFFGAPLRPRSASSDVSEKVLVAIQTEEVDPAEVVRAQRELLVEELRDLRHLPKPEDLVDGLAADWKASQIEGELAWLDRAEEHLRQPARSAATSRVRRGREHQ